MKVLLSIKPEFAEKIFNGTKKYEFRKSIFKNKDVDKVISALDNTNLTNCALFIRKYNKNTYVRLRYN